MQTPDTPQLTPIEEAIKELEKQNSVGYSRFTERNIEHLKFLLPYECQHLRDVAEKAWDAAIESMKDDKSLKNAKQTYLNEKHPC